MHAHTNLVEPVRMEQHAVEQLQVRAAHLIRGRQVRRLAEDNINKNMLVICVKET